MMRRGNLFFIGLIFVVLLSSFALGAVGDVVQDIFTLGFLSDVGVGEIDAMEGFIRFLLLIMIFALLFKAAELLKLGKNISIVIAGCISLISAIFVPGTILVAAATSYGTIVSFLILGLPIAFGLFGYFMLKDNHWIRFVVVALTTFVLIQMENHMDNLASGVTASYMANVMDTVDTYIWWVIAVMIVLGVVTLVQALGNMGGSSEYHPNWVRGLWDKAKQKTVLTEKGKELRHAKREETRILSDLVVAEKEFKILEEAEKAGDSYNAVFLEINNNHKVNSKHHLESLNLAFQNLKSSFGEVTKIHHKWKRAQRKEVTEMERLIKEMISKGITDATRKPIEEKEKLILGMYAAVSEEVKECKKMLDIIEKNNQIVYESCKKVYNKVPETMALDKNNTGFPGLSDYKIGGVNVLAEVSPAREKILYASSRFLLDIKEAKNKEKIAVSETIKLADEIKKKWVV
ncbi:MAG: hypothetical protein KJ597_04360 [Nanoarchaeota archaeon]|nr:hypothetical protein [Nanoarchaeota archaeon]MBU1622781.1 hypothetical protein [Nanoarchaeota archaeon]